MRLFITPFFAATSISKLSLHPPCSPIESHVGRGHLPPSTLPPFALRALPEEDAAREAAADAPATDSSGGSKAGGMRGALAKLKSYGQGGLLSYGAINALYYNLAFTIVWCSGAGAGALGGGTGPASRKILKVLTAVWAGSQVTKLPRAALAAVLAPVADKLLTGTQRRLGLKHKGSAFRVLVASLWALTAMVVALTLLSTAASEAVIQSAFSLPLSVGLQCQGLDNLAADMPQPKGAAPKSKQKPKKVLEPPPNPNIHGWNEFPQYLLGYWNVTSTEPLGSGLADVGELEGGRRLVAEAEVAAMDLFSRGGQPGYMVLQKGGRLKVGSESRDISEVEPQLVPRGWRYTPANRRIVIEVEVPRQDITLRYSLQVKRLVKHFTRGEGNVRVRKGLREPQKPGMQRVSSSDRRWPKVWDVRCEKTLRRKWRAPDPEEE